MALICIISATVIMSSSEVGRERQGRARPSVGMEADGCRVPFTVHNRERVRSRGRLQGDFVKVVRFPQIGVVQMPVEGDVGLSVGHVGDEVSRRAVQLAGQGDACPGGGIDELHGLERIFAASGFEGGQGAVFGMMLPVVPFPDGRQDKPTGFPRRLVVGVFLMDAAGAVGG